MTVKELREAIVQAIELLQSDKQKEAIFLLCSLSGALHRERD